MKEPIVFYDGTCGLCHFFIQFILINDHKGLFYFSPLQGESAKRILSKDQVENLNTVVLFENGKTFTKSDAALRILSRLSFPWFLMKIFLLIPKFLRNGLYQLVSKHRFRFFGKVENCLIPSEAERKRFID